MRRRSNRLYAFPRHRRRCRGAAIHAATSATATTTASTTAPASLMRRRRWQVDDGVRTMAHLHAAFNGTSLSSDDILSIFLDHPVHSKALEGSSTFRIDQIESGHRVGEILWLRIGRRRTADSLSLEWREIPIDQRTGRDGWEIFDGRRVNELMSKWWFDC